VFIIGLKLRDFPLRLNVIWRVIPRSILLRILIDSDDPGKTSLALRLLDRRHGDLHGIVDHTLGCPGREPRIIPGHETAFLVGNSMQTERFVNLRLLSRRITGAVRATNQLRRSQFKGAMWCHLYSGSGS
jgi:hypothetical protein